MKHPSTKLLAYLVAWTVGVAFVAAQSRLLLFVGVAMIITSELLTLRRSRLSRRIIVGAVPFFMMLVLIPCFVTGGRFPFAFLAGFWLLGIVEQIFWWRRGQRLT